MKKRPNLFFILITAVIVVLVITRFFLGGNEDTWICENGGWVKHGNPQAPKPESGCGETENAWIQQDFSEAGVKISFLRPRDTVFRTEIARDGDRVRVASFYVEKGDKDNPTYQLYGLYQPLSNANESDLEKAKTGLEQNSIKELTVGGFKAIEGLANATDPKAHYITVVLVNNKLFSLSTWPPKPDNKTLTDELIKTIRLDF